MKKKKTEAILIEQDDDFFGAVLNCAVRYCLGRQSYMPGLVMDKIRPWLPHLTNKTLWCFIRDIEEAPSLGHPLIDRPAWLSFLHCVKGEMKGRRENGLYSEEALVEQKISLRDLMQGHTVDLDADAREMIHILTEDGRLLPFLMSDEDLIKEVKRRGYVVSRRAHRTKEEEDES